jgi:hypothetical protein
VGSASVARRCAALVYLHRVGAGVQVRADRLPVWRQYIDRLDLHAAGSLTVDNSKLHQEINAEHALREAYKGGVYPAMQPGDLIDVNSMYPAVMRPDDTTAPVDPAPKSTVKASFTVKRRSKRPRRDVETMDYLGAARRFIRAAGRRVGECDEPELAALLELRAELELAIADAVEGQRRYGKSWAGIARGTGTTREAAFQRWGKK